MKVNPKIEADFTRILAKGKISEKRDSSPPRERVKRLYNVEK
jgi:hypothetical protein